MKRKTGQGKKQSAKIVDIERARCEFKYAALLKVAAALESESLLEDEIDPPLQTVGDWIDQGNLSFENGDFEQAMMFYQSAIAADQNCFEAHLYSGIACMETQFWENADDHFLDAWQLKPDNSRPLIMLARYHLNKGDADTAKDFLQDARELTPILPEIDFYLGLAHREAGENVAAIPYLIKFVKHDPLSPKADIARSVIGHCRQDARVYSVVSPA